MLNEEGMVELGKACALCPWMTSLHLSAIGAESSAGVALVSQLLGRASRTTGRWCRRLACASSA